MRLVFRRLRVSNFKVIESADISLENRGLVLIKGENDDTDAADSVGSGKTTLFEAISWCLFGEVSGIGKLGESAVRRGASTAVVSLSLFDGEHEYVITRRRSAGKGSVELTTDGSPTNARTLAEMEARIQEILGLDWMSFRNTVLYAQGDHLRFADAGVTDADRKAVLKKILRLEQFDEALKRAREQLKELGQQREEVGVELLRRQDREAIFVKRIAELEGQQRRWTLAQQERLQKIDRQIADLGDLTEARKAARSLPKIRELLAQLDGQVEALDKEYQESCRVGRERTKAAADAEAGWRELNREMIVFSKDLGRLENQIKSIEKESDTCKLCGRPMDEEHQQKREEGLMALREQFEEGVRQEASLEQRVGAAKEQWQVLKLQLAEHDIAHDNKREAVEEWEAQQRKLREREREAVAASDKLAGAEATLTQLQARRAEVEFETSPHLEYLRNAEAERDAVHEDVLIQQHRLAALDERERPLKFWEQAFSNRGLPSYVMDSVVPIITESANRYLQTLADGDIMVDVDTQKDLKSGASKEAIDFKLCIEGLADVVPSGGQRKKISIAIDLALMDLVASREGAKLDILLLDEVLDGLDGEGCARVVQLLRELRETRSSIFVVSHDPTVAEHFENVLMVRKSGKKSTVMDA